MKDRKIFFKSLISGIIAAIILLIVYFLIVSLISGWNFSVSQFYKFWYYFITLSIGFGIQIGLYTYAKNLILQKNISRNDAIVSGATSTIAMISCCAHYLANIIPIIATTGIIAIISQYQIQLFWVGIIINLTGIVYILKQIFRIHNNALLS